MRPSRRPVPARAVVERPPITGMRDSLAPASGVDGKAQFIQNAYPWNADIGAALVGRPGFQQSGSQLAGAGRVQGIYQFTKKNGTQYTIAIAGGRLFTFNWGTRVWSEPVTTANLTTASITLDTSARVSFNTLNDLCIVSDGVNTPFAWDGTSGSGGLTKLTAAPVFYGPPTVYYAHLFGIKASDRLTADWSETNSPSTGYENAPFNDSWTIGQSSSARLTCLFGTNASLQVFRDRSYTAISGAVDTQFATTGTVDGTSTTVGTKSPWAVVAHEARVFFLDADGKPRVRSLYAGVEDSLWRDFQETVRQINTAAVDQAIAVNYYPASLILFAVPTTGSTDPTQILAVRVWESGQEAAAVWTWNAPFTALAMCLDGSGAPVLMHGDANGYVFDHGNPTGALFDDFVGTASPGTTAIQHVVTEPYLIPSPSQEKVFDRIDLAVLSETTQSLDLTFNTPWGQSALPSSLVATGVGDRLDTTFTTDVSKTAGTSQEQHVDAGIDCYGRWIQPTVSHQRVGEKFGLLTYRIEYQPTDLDPAAP